MTKKKFILMTLMMVMLPLSSVQVSAASRPIPLTGGYVDPTLGDDNQRSPLAIPLIEIEDYTLFFVTPCDSSVLRLLDEDGDVYSTVMQVLVPTILTSTPGRIPAPTAPA